MRTIEWATLALAVVVGIGFATWWLDRPTYAPSEFYRSGLPETGGSYVIKVAYLGVPDREDLELVVPPYPYMEPERIERMVQRGDAAWLEPGDEITLLEVSPDDEKKASPIYHARVASPHGDLWVLLSNVVYVVKSEPLLANRDAADAPAGAEGDAGMSQ